MPVTPITPAQIDEVARLAEIPPVGSEERDAWLERAKRQVFAVHKGFLCTTAEGFLTLMSDARKQGQIDMIAAERADDATLDRALDAFFGHLPHPDKPWGGSWRQQMRDALRAARGPMDQQSADFIADCDRIEAEERIGCAQKECFVAAEQKYTGVRIAKGGSPCFWGGGNDIIWCGTCGAEYAYAKGEARPPCPLAASADGDPQGEDPQGAESRSDASAVGEAGTPEVTPSIPPSARKGQEENPCPMMVEEARSIRSLLDDALALLEVDDEANTPGTDTYTFIVTTKDALRRMDAAGAISEEAISAKAKAMCSAHCDRAEGQGGCPECAADQEHDWRADAELALSTILHQRRIGDG